MSETRQRRHHLPSAWPMAKRTDWYIASSRALDAERLADGDDIAQRWRPAVIWQWSYFIRRGRLAMTFRATAYRVIIEIIDNASIWCSHCQERRRARKKMKSVGTHGGGRDMPIGVPAKRGGWPLAAIRENHAAASAMRYITPLRNTCAHGDISPVLTLHACLRRHDQLARYRLCPR